VKEVAVSTVSDEEFGQFMRGRWVAMVRLAYALSGDAGHAEDIAQAAFTRAYAAWPRVSRAGDPDAYVRQIVSSLKATRPTRHRSGRSLTT
jgi:DNA-directed RNA polymerase specialized sigma24 family protein